MRKNRTGQSNLWHDYLSMFFIALANPVVLLIFIALFAAVNLGVAPSGFIYSLAILAGVFAGGALWWFTLTFIINLFRKKLRPIHLLWMNRIAGAAIFALGLLTILLLIFHTSIKEAIDGVIKI